MTPPDPPPALTPGDLSVTPSDPPPALTSGALSVTPPDPPPAPRAAAESTGGRLSSQPPAATARLPVATDATPASGAVGSGVRAWLRGGGEVGCLPRQGPAVGGGFAERAAIGE